MIRDYEQALIYKGIEDKALYKLFNADIGKCLNLWTDVWDFIIQYHSRYKQAPTFDIVQKKFPEFEREEVEDVTLEYLIDEVQTVYITKKATESIEQTIEILNRGDPRKALVYGASELSSIIHTTQTIKDVDLAGDYQLRINSLKERIESFEQTGSSILGVPTTIPAIDLIYGGLQKGDFIVVMGWTGSSKTWLATYLSVQAWKQGFTPLYISLEMDDDQFGYRFDTLVGDGKFSNIALMNGRGVDPEGYAAWATGEFQDKHPFHLVTNESVDEMSQTTVASKIEQYSPDLVVIDYHGLMEDSRHGKSETEKHKNISRDLKKIAGRYSVPIIDIAAVTMPDGHGERMPRLNEIAWAKALAYDADLVLSMFKQGQVVSVGSEKTRRCNPFAFTLIWDFDKGTVNVKDWS